MADDPIVNGEGEELPDLSNRELLKLFFDEMAIIRGELFDKIIEICSELKVDIKALKIEVKQLRSDVHHNQLTFMKNHEELEGRVTVLEAKVR